MITKNSTATFIFKNKFTDHDEALDWLYNYIESGLGTQLDLEVIDKLNGSKIIIDRKVFDNFYDITFTNIFDIDGKTPIRFLCIPESHFRAIVEPKKVEMVSIPKEELERLKSIENKFNQYIQRRIRMLYQ